MNNIKLSVQRGSTMFKMLGLLIEKPMFTFEINHILKTDASDLFKRLRNLGIPVIRTRISGRRSLSYKNREYKPHVGKTTIYYLESQRKEAFERIKEFGKSTGIKNSIGHAILDGEY